ncbi:2-oxo-4-hydroxy-4-carboxy-5-ureidoimidazoline decarboxylase [Dermatobacter hominis]|uniref:2-oxo-4-hydroxy-4-carboxy-5-ureidoimidazoline decarboxylase n=1 Tax=Dermatobacter hominis TaxID=2884263 RepID=UPI001D0F7D06|nr:2-oxo-4-hydroxy-4-carboxy-5-ureidoimidazoline decarboxylase [Dermatobacter hominis]UDY37388.1 2-oxo-4-hydroxy-4-carboxy-5-ureidoimidazoline decarboxylase [Dermatobacter hominis]
MSTWSVAEVSSLDRGAFLQAFGEVYEDSPQLADAAFGSAPFADLDALVDGFHAAAHALDDEARLALLRAHPQLGARRPMADASIDEQRSVGLDRMDDDVARRLAAGNADYVERHGFPFIIAVRGRTQAEVLDELERRLPRSTEEEADEAFAQVQEIAALRIRRLVSP